MADKLKPNTEKQCGIVMPISGCDIYSESHWSEVRDIIERAIKAAQFEPVPVWERSETDIIQGRIIRNLYELELVICDVSGLNPNVMFELGLRLAFKKPVIIITDGAKKIPFDTNSIEHIFYDRNLQFQNTERFIEILSAKVTSLVKNVEQGKFEPFLDTLGTFHNSEFKNKNIDLNDFVLSRLEKISFQLTDLDRKVNRQEPLRRSYNSMIELYAEENENSKEISPPRWTEDKEKRLIELWESGLPASQIARFFGGISRNAVIGKAHRLGLKPRPAQDPD